MEDTLLIVNPRSGVDKNKEKIIETAARLCESRGLRLNIEFTSGPGNARLKAEEGRAKGTRCIICAGGDGTVRDVADGLWGSDVLMGIIPMGSGNGLARSLGIPQDPVEALHTALDGHDVIIDRGVANGQSFYSAFGMGMDAEVSYRFAQDGRRGRTTYIKHAVKQMFTYKPKRFRIMSGKISIETDALLLAVCNCMQYGNNAYISPKAMPTDGQLDITVVHQGSFLAKAIAGIDLFSGTLANNILVEMFRVDRLNVICGDGISPCISHLDGEPEKVAGEVDIYCDSRGLKIAVPEGARSFTPLLTPMKALIEDIRTDIKKSGLLRKL